MTGTLNIVPNPLQIYPGGREKYQFGLQLAIDHGIATVCREAPILEIGSGNPYLGFRRYLKKFGWKGEFYAIDGEFPEEVVEWWKPEDDLYVQSIPIETLGSEALHIGEGVLPPREDYPYIGMSAAYAFDVFDRIITKDKAVTELKRVAAQVIIIGGVEEKQLRQWDFQITGTREFNGVDKAYGFWMVQRGESLKRAMDIIPEFGTAYFSGTGGLVQKMTHMHVCQLCGTVDLTGHEKFPCRSCGHDNL